MTAKNSKPRSTPRRHDRYMGLAIWIGQAFSKDPSTQVGAVIVGPQNRPLGWGYNGPPRKIDDRKVKWIRPNKYHYVRHAEQNAISHSAGSLEGCVLYVSAKPCQACMLEIVDAGISQVYFLDRKTCDPKSSFAKGDAFSRTFEIAKLGGVKLVKFRGDLEWTETTAQEMLEVAGLTPV